MTGAGGVRCAFTDRGSARAAVLLVLLTGCGARPLPAAPAAGGEPDVVAEAAQRLLRRRAASELVALDPAARHEAVFVALYNQVDAPKPCSIDQAEYERRLAVHAERAHVEGAWHVRWGVEGTADLAADARRIYFDVVPDHAAALADFVVEGLDARGVPRFSFKVLTALDTFDIPVPAVLYVEAPFFEAAAELSVAFAAAHPEALVSETPPLTRELASGVGTADELGAVGPPGVAGSSFGGAMAHLFAVALEGAEPTIDAPTLAARMREALRAAGFDPSRPWLRPGRR